MKTRYLSALYYKENSINTLVSDINLMEITEKLKLYINAIATTIDHSIKIINRRETNLKYGDVVVNLGSVSLGDTLRNPDDVATFLKRQFILSVTQDFKPDLLLQLEEGVEDSIVKLLHEGIDVKSDLVLKELILESLLTGISAGSLEALLVLPVVFSYLPHLGSKCGYIY